MPNYAVRPPQCRHLAKSVTAIGGTIPAELTNILASMDAVTQWEPKLPTAIHEVVRSGRFNAKNASKLLDDALATPSVEPGALRAVAAAELARQFTVALTEGAADNIFKGLRSQFDTACAGIAEARNYITADTQPAQVLELGDAAITAWRDLDTHRRVLDGIHNVIDQLVGTDFNLITPRAVFDRQHAALIAAMYVPNADVNLDLAARWFTPEANTGRGGRWMNLQHALHLNTIAEATAIVDQQEAERIAADRKHYEATHS